MSVRHRNLKKLYPKDMNVRYFLIMAACLAAMMVCAQKRLAVPLTYVPADSVVTWVGGVSEPRSTALALDPSLRERPLGEAPGRKAFGRLVRHWDDAVAPRLNLLGGLGPEDAPQVTASAAVLDEAAELLRLTADARYADALERGLFNLMGGTAAAPGDMTLEKHVAAQALVDGMGRMLATAAGSLYVNFYVNSTTHVRLDGYDCVVDILTALPSEGRVRVRLSGFAGHPRHICLCLRLPGWAVGRTAPSEGYAAEEGGEWPQPEVRVNGRELLSSEVAAGYFVIDREWNSGDEALIELPMEVQRLRRVEGGREVRGAVALQRGPLVYALSADHAGCYLSGNEIFAPQADYGEQGEVVLSGHLRRDAGTPADSVAPAVSVMAVPYMTAPRTVWIREMR